MSEHIPRARSDSDLKKLHARQLLRRRYQVIAAPACEAMARRMEDSDPDRFFYHASTWDKFPDGTDHIVVGGFSPQNFISGEHVLLLASFHNNDVTLSQRRAALWESSASLRLPRRASRKRRPSRLYHKTSLRARVSEIPSKQRLETRVLGSRSWSCSSRASSSR